MTFSVECNNISFSYNGHAWAINNLSTRINPGEFVCVLGGNGSGKSSFAKHLNALLVPEQGTVFVGGMNTADADVHYLIRKNVGMVFQNPNDQLVATVVKDDVAFGPENLGVAPSEIHTRVTEALERVGLAGYEARDVASLSGGQKQRLAIAGVLAMRPRVIILDEASAMLDPRGKETLLQVVEQLHAHGFTIIMITHCMDEAARAQRVIVMNNGSIALDGTPESVLTNACALKALHIDVPFSVQLSLACNDYGLPVPVTLDETALEDALCSLVLNT